MEEILCDGEVMLGICGGLELSLLFAPFFSTTNCSKNVNNYWETLARVRWAYEEEKERIAKATIGGLDQRWPSFASQIEVVDVATPATYVRYTGNWQGSPDGWYITPDNMKKRTMLRTLPGLSGLYMVGQWTAPFTGTVIAALSGPPTRPAVVQAE